jgi:ABC-type glycerol-3-phosphate transport system substrate-binding protein
MKKARILSLFLALLMLLSVLVACGDKPEETTKGAETTAKVEEEDPRQLVKDTVPTDVNYAGETVTFFVRNDTDIYKYEIACEELLNDTLYDAIHYRNIDVETRLGLKIKTIEQDGAWGKHTEWNNTLSTSVLTNTGDFDGCAFYLSTGSPLAKEGIYYNLMELTGETDGYLNFEKPWWNQTIVNELAVYGSLFFAGGSLTLSEISGGTCLFFNRDLFNERFPDERDATLYQLVRDGKWTVDKLAAYVAQVWDDLNSNGVIDDGDVVGTRNHAIDGTSAGQMDAWIVAMGLKLTETDIYGEPTLALFNNHTVPAYEAVRSVFGNNPGALLQKSGVVETAMENGNVLFYNRTFSFGATMRESTVNYGVLPIPKYDEDQEDYYTGFGNAASAVAICSNLDSYRAAMTSAVLELLSAESYKQVIPVYYGTVLQGQYSREQADAEMYNIILDSFVFSFGFAYSTQSLGAVGNIFRDLGPTFDIQNHIDSNKETWERKLEELLIALDAVAS